VDKIIIHDLRSKGIIGVYDWERQEPQEILTNLILYTDLQKAGQSDNINDIIDYEMVARKVQKLIENEGKFTVEALAAEIANLCLQIPNIMRVRVRVEKPRALPSAQSVGIEIERSIEDFQQL